MNLQEAIRKEEREFPRLFASCEEKPYGLLFYMDDNHDSYDGNHAIIEPEKITDLGAVLRDITAFYHDRGIRPSIYHPHVPGYFNEHEEVLKAHGYTCTAEEDRRVMLLTAENDIRCPRRMDIRVLHAWDERVARDILLPSGEPWEVAVTQRRAQAPGAYLFVGYVDNRAVAYTDIHVSKLGNTRFDYIVTASDQRGKGYASELLSFVTDYCREQGLPNCWQWAGPSENICYRAGFRQSFTMEGGYATGPEIK